MKVIKKDGSFQEYSEQKIIDACELAAKRALYKFTEDDYGKICNRVADIIAEEDFYSEEYGEEIIPVSDMHAIVEKALSELFPTVAERYIQYRNYKQDFVKMLDKVYKQSQQILYIGDKENSNTDSALVPTQRSLIFNELNTELYKKFFLNAEELQAIQDGYIYIHDKSARNLTMNCCLFDIANVMKGGFEMGNLWYNEPKTLDVAFDVMGDLILNGASSQYGGFTCPEVDKILEPYAEKSYEKYKKEFLEFCDSNHKEKAEEYAMKKVRRDMEQGYQGLEYKLNSVGSSRGDYPFTTFTFGLSTSRFGSMLSSVILDVHKNGQGKEGNKIPTLFPKLVFLYDDELHGDGKELEWLYLEALDCSSKCMYPDFLSLCNENTTIGKMYKKYGKVISPMGKRKLSPYKTF